MSRTRITTLTAAVTDPDAIESRLIVEVTCEAPNRELLLVDWLNAIIYEMATRKLLFGCFRVTIDGNRMDGRMEGEAIDVERHAPAAEVKGATMSELEVKRQRDQRWPDERDAEGWRGLGARPRLRRRARSRLYRGRRRGGRRAAGNDIGKGARAPIQ